MKNSPFASAASVRAFSLVPNRLSRWFTFAILIAAFAAYPMTAQLAGTGAIAGTVQDPAGAMVANATVTATNVATNVAVTRTTTKAGDFNITSTTEIRSSTRGPSMRRHQR